MAVTVEVLEGLERQVVLSLPMDEMHKRINERLLKARKNARVDGFRPGKAPLKMIDAMYGASIRQEVLNDLAVDTFQKVVAEQNIAVASIRRMTEVSEQDDEKVFKLNAVFEVYPEITVGDLSGVTVERIVGEVKDEDVDNTINVLREQRTVYNHSEEAAQKGDRVIVDFVGKIDGETFAGGSAENMPFVIGKGQMLADFEQGVVGMKEGEAKDIEVNFPEDYHGADVAGKTAIFTLTLKSVANPKLPELDADFARSLGIEDGNIDTMKTEIRKNISREIKRRQDEITKQNVMAALLDATPIEVPEVLIQDQISRHRQNFLDQMSKQGVDVKQFGELPDDAFRDRAKKDAALGLILAEIVTANKLQANEEQVRQLVTEFADSYEDPQEVIDWYLNDKNNYQGPFAMATEANVVAYVLERAKVEDKEISFAELMSQGQPMPMM